MSQTIGRVDFLVSLDGKQLPREAREVGRKAGLAGGQGFSDGFDKGVDSSFDRKLTDLGDRVAQSLGDRGKLAGSKFSTDFQTAVSSRFRKMQRELANILSDRDAFESYARGFDSIGEAVERVQSDLERLTEEQVSYRTSSGKVKMQDVLTEKQFDRLSASAERMGAELQTVVDREKALEKASADLEARHRRLVSLVGDSDAFRQLSEKVGGTEDAYRRLRLELEGSAKEMGLSRHELDATLDRLDRTKISVDKLEDSHRRLSLRWGDLSHNGRQWTLIIGAIAAAMQHLAGLSSALGAGILALGGTIVAGVAGIGGAVAIFSSLNQELDDLPESMRGVAAQFQGLKGNFTGLRDTISAAAFKEMPLTFARLGDVVDRLGPAASVLGTSVGKVFDGFTVGLQKGSKGFAELERLVASSGDDFEKLAGAAGTWSVALLRGLNKANPLTDQLIGYVEKLGQRFDDFTRSSSFDDWIARSSHTFTTFGELLDATARALNDLVTPESLVRTQGFMDNLAAFMPNLSRMLDILGRLDVFGLAAQLLSEFGEALEPLAGPMGELADFVSEAGAALISSLAVGLGLVADIIAPVVQGLADMLNALPPGAVDVLAASVVGLAAAFALLRGATALAGVLNGLALASGSMGAFTLATGVAEAAGGKLAGTLKGFAGKAGLWGLVATGALFAVDAVYDLRHSLLGIDDVSRELVGRNASLADSYDTLTAATYAFPAAIDDWDAVIDGLVEMQNGFLGLQWPMNEAQWRAVDLQSVLGELDGQISKLPLENAQEMFAGWATEVGATDEEILAMLDSMPILKQQLIDNAAAAGVMATGQDLVKLALGDSKGAIEENVVALEDLVGSSVNTRTEVDALAEKIRNFGNDTLNSRSAARDFEASLDDLAESLIENGATLDINTAQGRENEANIDKLVTRTLEWSAALLEETGSMEGSNEVIGQGRQKLIEMLEQLNITGAEAEAYADKLGLIPEDVYTKAALVGVTEAENALNILARNRTSMITVGYNDATGNRQPGMPGSDRPFATGGLIDRPTRALMGEAGPELVVPLRRPLSQVDPKARWLSGIAQGMIAPPMTSTPKAATVVTFAEGSIVVQGAQDPRRAALEVADAVAERVAS